MTMKKRQFEAAFTDYDGTIVCEHGTPLPDDVKTAFRALPADMPIFIATGRSLASAPMIAESLQPKHEMVFENGACITDHEGRILAQQLLGQNVVKNVLNYCAQIESSAVVRYVDDTSRNLYSPQEMPLRQSRGLAIARLGIDAASTLAATLADELPVATVLTYKHRADGSKEPTLRVQRAGVSKGAALSYLVRRYAINPRNTLAAGNDTNDLSMFSLAGTTAAPVGAVPEIVAQADIHYPSPRDGGYREVLRRLYTLSS